MRPSDCGVDLKLRWDQSESRSQADRVVLEHPNPRPARPDLPSAAAAAAADQAAEELLG